ncbi:hypothetical protein niasHT_009485 [Heterodera trifolii]|uniref:Uncharacterized protein n=1 Tax=Heterodera trifolii TaxID=157864 RepID=A0ABD2M8G6_9BILA
MAPGGKTYARLKNASKPIGSSSEDEEDELPRGKKMPLPTMKAPMYTKKPAVKVLFEQPVAAPDKTTTRPVKRNRTGMGTDTALFQQPAPQKLTTTRKSAKGNAAAPSSSSSVSVRIPPRRVRSHRDVAAQQPQQRKLEKRKAAAPQLNENCPGDHRHPSQTLLEQQNNALYRLLFDGSKENYFTHLERARHFVHTCAVCAKKYEFVLVRFPDTGVETPWHPVLPKHENLRDGWTLSPTQFTLSMQLGKTVLSLMKRLEGMKMMMVAMTRTAEETTTEEETKRRVAKDGTEEVGKKTEEEGAKTEKGETKIEKEEKKRSKTITTERGEKEREEERREEEEEEQSGHNEERGEKKRREEGRGKDGGEEEDDGRGEEETRERGDEEETEEAREKLKRGEEKERGEKGGGGKETNGGRRSENGGKAKEGRNEGGGKAGEKKQPPPGSKMTHSQWRRVMRLNKKKGLKEGQDNAHPATIFNVL